MLQYQYGTTRRYFYEKGMCSIELKSSSETLTAFNNIKSCNNVGGKTQIGIKQIKYTVVQGYPINRRIAVVQKQAAQQSMNQLQ